MLQVEQLHFYWYDDEATAMRRVKATQCACRPFLRQEGPPGVLEGGKETENKLRFNEGGSLFFACAQEGAHSPHGLLWKHTYIPKTWVHVGFRLLWPEEVTLKKKKHWRNETWRAEKPRSFDMLNMHGGKKAIK